MAFDSDDNENYSDADESEARPNKTAPFLREHVFRFSTAKMKWHFARLLR